MKNLIPRGSSPNPSTPIPFAPHCNALVLAANTEETITVPDGMHYVSFFSPTINVYVKNGGAASVPVADVSDGTASEPNPALRSVLPGDVLHVISSDAGAVSIMFYD